MVKIKSISGVLMGSLVIGSVAYADFSDGLVGGLVGGAVGSVITNEIYDANKPAPAPAPAQSRPSNTSYQQRYVAPQNTTEMKIQKALASLGFYRGRIDGEINSFESRSAIKEMNMAYEIGNTASLDPQARDALIFLGTLFEFDRYLIARGTDNRTKGKKIQTALKIHGFYFTKIDGAVGPGTRKAIGDYKASKGLSYGNTLDFEEEYQLVSSAKEINDRNIEDTINSLKALGAKQAPQDNNIKIKQQ